MDLVRTMLTKCPHCWNSLRLARRHRNLPLRCPYCRRAFRADACSEARLLWAALDVSSSAEPFFADMLDVFAGLVGRDAGRCFTDIGVSLFHRQVVSFPCAQLGGLQPASALIMPTLQDLRERVGRGTAVLDALHHMLQDAERPEGSRELVILTDGGDRSSRRHPEEVRYRIEQTGGRTTIYIHIFTKGVVEGHQLSLFRKLSLPQILWSIHAERPCAEVYRVPIAWANCAEPPLRRYFTFN